MRIPRLNLAAIIDRKFRSSLIPGYARWNDHRAVIGVEILSPIAIGFKITLVCRTGIKRTINPDFCSIIDTYARLDVSIERRIEQER